MMNSAGKSLQQKREEFMINMKRLDRESLFANNRKKFRQDDDQTHQVEQLLHLLNGSIVIYNRKDIKINLRRLLDYNKFLPAQELKLIKLIQMITLLKGEEDNSSLHNDCLNILVQLSLMESTHLFELLPTVCKLMDIYNNHINQGLAFNIIDKILAFIGNISCNPGFKESFTMNLITSLVYQIQFGQKRLLFQTIWTLNNILFALHNEKKILEQILIEIGSGELPQYLTQYMKKNENKLEKNQLVSIYWLFGELSQVIPHDIAEFQIMDGENEDLLLIILFIYNNLTGQKVLPKFCNFDQLLNIFYRSNNKLVQRQILIIVNNLLLLIDVDLEQVKNLIVYSIQQYPIDTIYLLHNLQAKNNSRFGEQQIQLINKVLKDLQSDPIMEQLMQQLKLSN